MLDRHQRADVLPTQSPRTAAVLTSSVARARGLGTRMRQARVAAHLTQRELGGTTFSKSYLSAVEHGKLTPSVQALSRLAERLGLPCAYFLGEEVHAPVGAAPAALPADEEQAERLQEAERLVQEGHYEDAIVLFAQSGQPERASWAREQYAQVLADQGRFRDAYEQLRRAFERSSR